MPFSSRDLVLGVLVPAVVAMVVTLSAARFSRQRDFTRTVGPLSIVLGFLAGYWLLDLGPILPKLDREWLPYASVFALGPVLLPAGIPHSFKFRLIVLAIMVFVAAWLLVPTRDSLEPSRSVHLIVWSGYTFLLSAGMLLIAHREANMDLAESGGSSPANLLWLFLMIATLAAAAGLLLLSGSLRFSQTAAAGMAAFAGFTLAYRFTASRSSLEGVAVLYSLFISAALLTGKVNSFSDIPTTSYLLLPLTPLAYGLAFTQKTGRMSWKTIFLVALTALLVCGLAVGPPLVEELSQESEY